MSFMNKVKNFFYEDVEEEIEEVKHEEPKKKFNPFKKEPKTEEVEVNYVEEKPKEVKQEANNDLSERELFKAERTFNFPMDLGDEIFDKEEEVVPKEEPKVETPVYTRSEPVKDTYTRSVYHNISREEPRKEEKKRFKPSPVISPVYGILDKNYTVDDVVDVDKTKEFSFDKKIVDFDSVRNRAYKDLDEELEKTMNNDIFYNLDDEEMKEEKEELQVEEPSVIITYDEIEDTPEVEAKEVEFKETEVKEEIPEENPVLENTVEITDEPVEVPKVEVEDEDEDISPDVQIEVPKKRRTRSASKKEDPEEVKKEKEDLFNLIDNMYSEDEEEEDE